MFDDGAEKKYAPSAKKIAALKKQGVVLRSKDFSAGLIFITVTAVLYIASHFFSHCFQENFLTSLKTFSFVTQGEDHFFKICYLLIFKSALLLFSVLFFIWLITLFSPFLFGGWHFSWQSLSPQFKKINLIANLQRMFSPGKMGIEIVKSILKAFLILSMLVMFFIFKFNAIRYLGDAFPDAAIFEGYFLIEQFIILMILVVLALMGFDMVLQYFTYQKQAKMTHQEMKEEQKLSESSPDIKRRLRSMQLHILQQNFLKTVPTADVIITNPTHYAIAIRYDLGQHKAPKVVAKGKGELAVQIKSLALQHGLPLYEAPLLARALYRTVDIGHEIQSELYTAVAIVLSYVYQLKRYQRGEGQLPERVQDLQIPIGLQTGD